MIEMLNFLSSCHRQSGSQEIQRNDCNYQLFTYLMWEYFMWRIVNVDNIKADQRVLCGYSCGRKLNKVNVVALCNTMFVYLNFSHIHE